MDRKKELWPYSPNADVVLQYVVTGVGVCPEVVNCQQTVLQLELIGDPRSVHVKGT